MKQFEQRGADRTHGRIAGALALRLRSTVIARGIVIAHCAFVAHGIAFAHGAHSPSPAANADPSMQSASMKANNAGIAMRWKVEAPVRPGSPSTVLLQFDGVTDPQGAVVRLQPDEGLGMGDAPASFGLAAGESASRSIALWHASAGLRYLHLFATQNGVTSVMSVPVPIGSAPLALLPSAPPHKAFDGERVVAMPIE